MIYFNMLYIVFLFITSLYASTADTLTQRYAWLHASEHDAQGITPPGITKSDTGLISVSKENLSIPEIRTAAFHTLSDLDLSPLSPNKSWLSFDPSIESVLSQQTTTHPAGLLQLLHTPSQNWPIQSHMARLEMWRENKKGLQTFRNIELHLTLTASPKAHELFTQLHTVGTLALAGLSKTMYTELSTLFDSILRQLEYCEEKIDLSQIALPQKTQFIDTMHGDLLPWQSIGTFAHYTRWLIEYRKSLADKEDANSAELHKIVTKQINSFLSPQWSAPSPAARTLFTSLSPQHEWGTALWLSDAYIKEFLNFAATQNHGDCKFKQIVDAYTKSAIEILNARECRFHFLWSIPAMKWAFWQPALSNTKDEKLSEFLKEATLMFTINVPTDYSETAECLLLDPKTCYQQSLDPIWSHTTLITLPKPEREHFIPGSDHFDHAQKWHCSFENTLRDTGELPPITDDSVETTQNIADLNSEEIPASSGDLSSTDTFPSTTDDSVETTQNTANLDSEEIPASSGNLSSADTFPSTTDDSVETTDSIGSFTHLEEEDFPTSIGSFTNIEEIEEKDFPTSTEILSNLEEEDFPTSIGSFTNIEAEANSNDVDCSSDDDLFCDISSETKQ